MGSSCPDPLPQPPPLSATLRRRRRHESGEILRLLNDSSTLAQVQQIHARILRRRLSNHHPTLLRLYSAHRRLDLVGAAFAQIPNSPPTIAWNLAIRANALNYAPLDAIHLYNRMIISGSQPDKFTFPFAISACSRCDSLINGKEIHASAIQTFDDPYVSLIRKGKEIHASAIKTGFFDDPYVQNALIHLYFTYQDAVDDARKVFDGMRVRTIVSWTSLLSGLLAYGELDEAYVVFELMPARNVVSWTAMIDGCVRNGRPDEAFRLFMKMREENVKPNEFTIVGLLIACTEIGSLRLGRWVHEFARESGGLERGVFVGTALVDMYSKCGSLEDAVRVFDGMPIKSLATWNSMITSLGVHGRGREAIALFGKMQRLCLRPDGITLRGLLCACVREGMAEKGYGFFRYMKGQYGIDASLEHYNCLLELAERDGRLEGAKEMVKDSIVELNDESQRTMIAASNMEVEEFVGSCIRRIDRCYEWEVG